MKRILKGVLYLGSLWLLLPGCMDDFEPSLIEEPRILALRAEVITDGDDAEAYRLEALRREAEADWVAPVAKHDAPQLGLAVAVPRDPV